MIDEETRDRATCYHEAAHAVFALEVARYTLKYVCADEWYTAARSPYPTGWADHYRAALQARAGFFAEMLDVFGETRPSSWEEFSEEAEIAREEYECGGLEMDDDIWILESIEEMSEDAYMGASLEDVYAVVIADTESELLRLWPQIEAVAEALSTSRRLTGDEVARIIAQTSQNDAGEES